MTGLATTASAKPSEVTGQKATRALKVRRTLGLIIAVIVLVLVVLASLAIGTRDMPVSEVLGAFFDPSGSDDQLVVLELRFPRTVLGILVGMGLGLAGGLIQALTRNPLADPGILGVNAGASFAVAIGIGFFGITSINGYIWFAFLGALVATAGVYIIGSSGRNHSVDPIRLTLAGVAVAAVLTGLTKGVLLTNERALRRLPCLGCRSHRRSWFRQVYAVAPFIIGIVLALFLAHSLNAVALGDDLAASLGTSVNRTRILTILAVTLLAGGATAAAGPIGFIGLMIPPHRALDRRPRSEMDLKLFRHPLAHSAPRLRCARTGGDETG